MKFLNGAELASYITERQAKQVRGLIQSKNIHPKLAIINCNPQNLTIKTYIKLKIERAEQLQIQTALHEIPQTEVPQKLQELTKDPTVHGIILQLPLQNPKQTEQLLSLIPPQKDVDGLNPKTELKTITPATPGAILWLLAGYNIDLKNKKILIIGQGRLVGAPLAKILQEQNLEVQTLDITNTPEELSLSIQNSDIIISATGSPGLIKLKDLKDGQVMVDAGTSEQNGKILGDVNPEVYNSKLNIKITPQKGGLGPLTISYLFENLLQLIDKN